jgi:hypothetical protein
LQVRPRLDAQPIHRQFAVLETEVVVAAVERLGVGLADGQVVACRPALAR